ncbi:MAG: acetophenone carboxylase [Sphingomonadales bacterium]|nr:acetophenone carboxylase [Sphingomonadales bacterium]
MKIRITEYLDIDLAAETWCCHGCGQKFGNARDNYKKGLLIAERPLEEVHQPLVTGEQFSFKPDPDYCRLIELYCPNCGALIDNEYLPPGHPLTHDIELDIDALKQKHGI